MNTQAKQSTSLVSVVIPTFNYGHFVSKAIESVLAQTYSNIEVIVVDDGSTDNTQDVLKKFEGKIKNIYQKNAGLSAARNTGIKASQGEYIAFLDSDDQWLSEKLEFQVKHIQENDKIALVSCNCEYINDEGQVLSTSRCEKLDNTQSMYDNLIQQNIIKGGGSCVLIRKSIFKQVGEFDCDLKSSEDWDMWLRISQIADMKMLPEALVRIRVGSDSMSSVKNAGRMLDNELKVLTKQEMSNSWTQKQLNRGYSYRYFCASWAYWKAGDQKQAGRYILKSFFKSPLDFLNKKQGGLMARIIIEKILRFSIPVNDITKPIFNFLYKVHVVVREALIVLLKILWFEPLFRSQCVQVGQKLWMEQLPYITGKGKIIIGDNVRLSGKPSMGFSTKVYPDPELIIGDHTFVGHQTRFAVAQKITIGKHCYLAGGVVISDNDGHPLDFEARRKNEPPTSKSVKEVTIEDDVWIGRDVVVLKGVRIGARSVIGSRAVVTKDVPKDSIVAGNPAKVLKSLKEES